MSTTTSSYLLFTGGYEGRIDTLLFRPHSHPATLEKVASCSGIGKAPTWLTFSQDRKTFYAIDEWGDNPKGTVHSLDIRDPEKLTLTGSTSSGGTWPCHSCLVNLDRSNSGQLSLLVINYLDAVLSSIPLSSTGEILKDREKFTSLKGKSGKVGPRADRQESDHPHGITLDPVTGSFIVVPDLGTDELRVLKVKENGDVMDLGGSVKLQDGDGPRHVVFDCVGPHIYLYSINELSNSVSVLRYIPPPKGNSHEYEGVPKLEVIQSSISILPPTSFSHQNDSFETWHCAELLVTPDHKFLYATNRAENHDPLNGTALGEQDLICRFQLDPSGNGKIIEQSKKLIKCGGRAARHFELSRDGCGKWLAVACHDSDEVIIFERCQETGDLTQVCKMGQAGRPGIVTWLN